MNSNSRWFGVLVVGVIALLVVDGFVYFSGKHIEPLAGASPAGSTYSNAGTFYAVTINTANTGTNGTSTSILNGNSDLLITGWRVACEGVGTSKTAYSGAGLANWLISIGTTSVANTASTSATAYAFAPVLFNFTVATGSTAFVSASSTTQTATSTYAAIWNANTNLTFILNATNTATCTVGVDAIGS